MATYAVDGRQLTNIANAIREKAGKTGSITIDKMPTEIEGILTGSVVEQATPSIEVNSSGLITSSATQSAGIVSAGTKSSTKQLDVQEAKTITPSANSQIAVSAGVYTTGDIAVAGDVNLKPENIAEGISIFGVTGSLSNGFPNGIKWYEGSLKGVRVDAIHYADGLWVISCGNHRQVTASGFFYSHDGITWTQSNITSDVTTNGSICNANGLWVASNGTGTYYSSDGMMWIKSNDFVFSSICNANGIWVACVNGDGIFYSYDGISWIQSNMTDGNFAHVYYANGMWVAGTHSGTVGELYYSHDGMTWTQSNMTSYNVNCIYYANGLWVAGTYGGIYYSRDGITWTSTGMTERTGNIRNANGIWVAHKSSSGLPNLFYSTDGIEWHSTNGDSGMIQNIENACGIWIASGSRCIQYSIDGKTWIVSEPYLPNAWGFDVLYNANGMWFANAYKQSSTNTYTTYYSPTWLPS